MEFFSLLILFLNLRVIWEEAFEDDGRFLTLILIFIRTLFPLNLLCNFMLNIIDPIFFVIERLTSRKVEYQMAVLINSLANLNIRIVNNERIV